MSSAVSEAPTKEYNITILPRVPGCFGSQSNEIGWDRKSTPKKSETSQAMTTPVVTSQTNLNLLVIKIRR